MSSAIASFGLDGSRICRPTTQALRSLYPTGQSLFSFLQERSFLLKTSAANARTTCNFRYGLSHWCSLAFGYSKPVPLPICMSRAPPNLVTLVSLRLDPPMKLMKQLEHRTILHRQPRTQELTYQAKTLAALPLTESKTGQQETPAESLKRSKRLKLSVEQICGRPNHAKSSNLCSAKRHASTCSKLSLRPEFEIAAMQLFRSCDGHPQTQLSRGLR